MGAHAELIIFKPRLAKSYQCIKSNSVEEDCHIAKSHVSDLPETCSTVRCEQLTTCTSGV